jgi:polysaccharide deacetylase 2 family uncharacterized protein YibQ
MLRRQAVLEPSPAAPGIISKHTPEPEPLYEVFPREQTPEPALPLPPPAPADRQPMVAIIIDDLGYDRRIARRFLALDTELTFSVLPHTPHTRSISREVRKKGRELILHLPMEPVEYPRIDPGPGALLTSMNPDELIEQLRSNLAAVPGIKGVNSHMGSRLTAAPDQMNQIFSILKQQNLYFVDSRSTSRTRSRSSAKLLQVPFAERDIFIDHVQDPVFIRNQCRKLIRIAKRKGVAIGIAHPYKTTFKVLQELLPELQKEVRLVPASQVVHVIG